MNPIETRLCGRDANLKGITRFINHHLGGQPLDRVELRYSTRSAEPLDPSLAQKAIGDLLREQGMGRAAVSVRAHAGQIDNATGEHVLRLSVQERPTRRCSGWWAWLAWLFPRWCQPVSSQTGAAATTSAPSAPKTPAVTPKPSDSQAVVYLRQAAELAATQAKADSPHNDTQRVAQAKVVVRLDYLHQTLGPMVQGDPNQPAPAKKAALTEAAQSIGAMLRKQGLSLSSDFTVSYDYRPRIESEGTSLANETDVEVVLVWDSDRRVEPTLDTPSHLPSSDGTLLPSTPPVADIGMDDTALPATAPALIVRVLGTLQGRAVQPFAQAFELKFAALPARFDRTALELAGFGQVHPTLLAVASNRCPLEISQGADKVVRIRSAVRTNADGSTLPMYYLPKTLTALAEEDILTHTTTQLVVNNPTGVQDLASGNTLPALVIELICAGVSP